MPDGSDLHDTSLELPILPVGALGSGAILLVLLPFFATTGAICTHIFSR